MAEKRKDRKGRILRDGENQLKDSTRSNYLYMYINYVSDEIGRKKVASIKYSDVKAFYNSLIREKGFKPNSMEIINTILIFIGTGFHCSRCFLELDAEWAKLSACGGRT